MQNEEYDVVVIGGGCVGSGVALEAATRGLKVALVEAQDFASGTVSNINLFTGFYGIIVIYLFPSLHFSVLIRLLSLWLLIIDCRSLQSGRSTKLIHGGVRYLEQAFKSLDYEMYGLVKEALEEVGQQANTLLQVLNSVSYFSYPFFPLFTTATRLTLLLVVEISSYPRGALHVASSGYVDSALYLVGDPLHVGRNESLRFYRWKTKSSAT